MVLKILDLLDTVSSTLYLMIYFYVNLLKYLCIDYQARWNINASNMTMVYYKQSKIEGHSEKLQTLMSIIYLCIKTCKKICKNNYYLLYVREELELKYRYNVSLCVTLILQH